MIFILYIFQTNYLVYLLKIRDTYNKIGPQGNLVIQVV